MSLRMARGIEVRREHYRDAALDRLAEVKHLRGTGRGDSALAAYLSGLSVECALRSLIPPGTEFYSRHDLRVLAELGALRLADEQASARLGNLLTELSPLWRNSLRFYPSGRFAAHCRKSALAAGLTVRRRANAVSVVCGRLFEISGRALTECERLWQK
jgi:HEPN domain-containing protein